MKDSVKAFEGCHAHFKGVVALVKARQVLYEQVRVYSSTSTKTPKGFLYIKDEAKQ